MSLNSSPVLLVAEVSVVHYLVHLCNCLMLDLREDWENNVWSKRTVSIAAVK